MPTNAIAAGAYAATQGLVGTSRKPEAGAAAGGLDFTSLVQSAVQGVAQSGRNAEAQAMAAAGGKADIVDVVTAVAESEAALETLVAVRDRVIAAYEEIMRMPI
ncbi:MAG TPA: flagellar hook-basal body complex protein FliE [Beijerinckiaceae bacterium]|nr:flagellar hook-basal body complex protein FliE [Beijerinckiaceae bacterium]